MPDRLRELWDLESGDELLSLKGQNGLVTAPAVLPGRELALSTSDDHTVRLWNLNDGSELAVFKGDAPFSSCSVAPDGGLVVAGDGAGQIHALQILL